MDVEGVTLVVVFSVLTGVSVMFEGSREDYFPDLMSWAAECGASCECFQIANFGDEGFGLKATKDIKVCVVIGNESSW